MYLPVFVDLQFSYLHAAQPCCVVAGHTVVVEEIPVAVILQDAVVCCPADNGVEDHTLIGERTVGIVADSIAEQVTVAGGVREIVSAVHLMHPAGLEESVRVVGGEWLSLLVDDDDGTWHLAELHAVGRHTRHTCGDGRLLAGGEIFVLECFVVAIPLQLSAPDTTEVDIDSTIVVLEDTRVDAVGLADRVGLRDERTFGSVGDGHTQAEDTIVVLCRKDQMVLAVDLHDIVIPHLLLRPGHVLDVEDLSAVGDVGFHRVAVDAQHVVVLHLEVTTVVVEGRTAVPVVGRVDIDLVVKHMG